MAGFFTAFAGGFAAQTNENIKTNEARRAEMIRDAMADFRAHIAERQKQIQTATERRLAARGDARVTGMSVDQAEALRAEGFSSEELRGGQVQVSGGGGPSPAPVGPAPNTPQAIPTAQQQPVTETPTSTMGNPATAQAVGMPEADPMAFSAQTVGQAPPQAQAAPMADPREQAQALAQTQAPAQAPQRGLGASVMQSLFGGPDASGIQSEVRNRYMASRGMTGDQLAALERGAPNAPTFEGQVNYNPIDAKSRFTEGNTQRRHEQTQANRLQAAAMRAAGSAAGKPAKEVQVGFYNAAENMIGNMLQSNSNFSVQRDNQGNTSIVPNVGTTADQQDKLARARVRAAGYVTEGHNPAAAAQQALVDEGLLSPSTSVGTTGRRPGQSTGTPPPRPTTGGNAGSSGPAPTIKQGDVTYRLSNETTRDGKPIYVNPNKPSEKMVAP